MVTDPVGFSSLPAKEIPYEASVSVSRLLTMPAILVAALAFALWRWPSWHEAIGLEHVARAIKLESNLPVLFLMFGVMALIIRLALVYAQMRLGHRPPRLVRQIITLVVGLVVGSISVAILWDVPFASLMTTSGLLVAVVGIALKNMISDLLNGISLPIKVGDWIEVAGVNGTALGGQVVEISWRATKLVGTDGVSTTVPNTHFITHPIRNFSSEGACYIERVLITLPTSVTAYQAERILVGAAHQVEAVAALPRIPEARIVNFNDNGVVWELRFPVRDSGEASSVRHLVQRILLRDFYYSGIELPVAQVEIHRPPVIEERPQREEVTFLSHIDLFNTMTHDELQVICNRMRPHVLRAGVPMVNQGDSGNSLFIVQEGLLSATINKDGASFEVGKIRPGQFFGEMSLLTGAVRSATVTPMVDSKMFEVDRDILAPILRDRPEIAAMMSRVLAERQLANAPKLENSGQMVAARDSLSQQILGHITAFFRLPAKTKQAMA